MRKNSTVCSYYKSGVWEDFYKVLLTPPNKPMQEIVVSSLIHKRKKPREVK